MFIQIKMQVLKDGYYKNVQTKKGKYREVINLFKKQ